MIVTIDGPAGAGKSCAARELARRLGFRFLDTGAMYRAVTLAAIQQGVELTDPDALAQLAATRPLRIEGERILIDGRDVTEAIRRPDVTAATRYAADHPQIRARLVDLQRAEAAGIDVVSEGRDQGTVVFPHAACKIFLTAGEEVRAERRHRDLQARGQQVSLGDVLVQQRQRDEQDSTRKVGALVQAADAIEVNTDGLTAAEVVERLEAIVRSRCGSEPAPGP